MPGRRMLTVQKDAGDSPVPPAVAPAEGRRGPREDETARPPARSEPTGAWRPGGEVGADQCSSARRRERTLSKRRETQLSPGLVVLKTLLCSHQPIPRASAGLRPGAQTGRQAHEVGKFFLWGIFSPSPSPRDPTQLSQVCGLCIWLHRERRRERLDLGISAEQEMSCACEHSVGAG